MFCFAKSYEEQVTTFDFPLFPPLIKNLLPESIQAARNLMNSEMQRDIMLFMVMNIVLD